MSNEKDNKEESSGNIVSSSGSVIDVRSGGIDLSRSTSGSINIGADVVGRDKVVSMTNTRGNISRRERERAQRRDDILQAARGVFFQRGFHTVTVDDIAVAAEVGKGTVYLYFDTKETILAHLLLEGLDMLVAELEVAYAADRRLAAQTRLRRMADAYLRFFKQNPEYYRLLMAFDRGQFQASIDPGVYQEVLARSLNGIEWLERAVKQAQAEGLITVENPSKAAGVLWAGLNGVLVLLSHPLRAEIIATDLESLYETMTDVLIDGLGK